MDPHPTNLNPIGPKPAWSVRSSVLGATLLVRPMCFVLAVVLGAAELLPANEPNEFNEPEEPATSTSTWTRLRGENGRGVVPTCNVPLPWSPEDVSWRIELPGKGNSSPIVADGKVFLMSGNPETAERYLLCYELTTGKELWRKTHASQPHKLHVRSSYASSTPCASDKAVYFAWADPENVMLEAYDFAGNVLWEGKKLGRYVSQHGFGASPALFGNTLILFNSQAAEELPPDVAPGQSRVLAFDATSGDPLWESPRTTTRACYGVPTLFKDQSGRDALLFTNTGDGMFALDLATGGELWSNKVFSKRTVSSPMIYGDLAIGTEGSGGGGNLLVAVSLTGDHEVRWRIDRAAPYVPTPVILGDLMFLWSDNGIVSCVKLPGDEIVWSRRVGGNVSTSPVVAGDKLVGIAEDGTVTIISASENFEELGSVKLEDTVRATPLVHRDYLIFRSDSYLMCVGKPQ